MILLSGHSNRACQTLEKEAIINTKMNFLAVPWWTNIAINQFKKVIKKRSLKS
jgi:hypothetical protein